MVEQEQQGGGGDIILYGRTGITGAVAVGREEGINSRAKTVCGVVVSFYPSLLYPQR